MHLVAAHRGLGLIAPGRVQAVIDGLVQAKTAVARLDGSVHTLFPVAIDAHEGEALRRWVVRERAATTIEVGLGYGISALYLCAGLVANGIEPIRHVVIDPAQRTRFADIGLQVLAEAGLANVVEHLATESQIALPRLLDQGRSFDFAFVDGNHRFDAVFVDLYFLGRLLRAGGVIMLDDYQLPGIQRAVSFFERNLDWTIEETGVAGTNHSWAVVRTRDSPDERAYQFFVEFSA